jgi:anti-sigma factor (TIGR02949 family)
MIISKLTQWLRRGPSCDEIMEVLQSYLDGEVDAETARRVAGHLERCTDCDTESDIFRSIKTSLANSAEPVDPEVLASLRAFSDRLVAGEIE